jgi:hypothetical protein
MAPIIAAPETHLEPALTNSNGNALRFRSLVRSLTPRGKRKLVAVLEVYLDESGINRPDWCVVAGYMGSDTQWTRFVRDWDNVVADAKAPPFHAKKFFPSEAFKYEYPGWSVENKKEYLGSLISIRRKYNLTEISGVVSTSLFKTHNKNERRAATGGAIRGKKWYRQGAPNRPYNFCLAICMHRVAVISTPRLFVHFYMDEQNQYAPNALDFHRRICQQDWKGTKFGGMFFANSREGKPIPLQLADMIAYLRFQEVAGEMSQLEKAALGGLVIKKDAIKHGDEATFRDIRNALPSDLRDSFPELDPSR